MLRSLVGSEMCIRDRNSCAGSSGRCTRSDRLGPARARDRQPIVRQLLNCLLYTSDAADDLLCVDLGGRRILKKKNKKKKKKKKKENNKEKKPNTHSIHTPKYIQYPLNTKNESSDNTRPTDY